MFVNIEPYLVVAAVLLILSVIASKVSERFGVPVLLLFLVIGMLAGSDGPGGIYFDNAALAQSVGVVALAVILFSGGLDTNWESIRPVLKPGLVLATLGVLITAGVIGLFAHWIFGLGLLRGMLLGSIVSSTDAAAVFSILRSGGVRLKGLVKPLLELESGANDPMAVFLTIGVIQLLLNPGHSPLSLGVLFLQQALIGAVAGGLAGLLLVFLARRVVLSHDGLYPVMVLGVVFLAYGVTVLLNGSGFLAVYIAGLMLSREVFAQKDILVKFFDGLGWLVQIVMFLTLGLLVFPSRLIPVILPALALAAVLILVARPLGVMIGLLFSRFTFRERAFISWVGLRGAVPIILATYPRLAALESSEIIFDVVFFVVLTSMLIQGTLIPRVARALHIAGD